MVERGLELGMDMTKLGYPDDLLDWMDERYRDPTTAIDTITANTTTPGCRKEPPSSLPKLQSFWFEMPNCSDMENELLRVDEKFVAKVRPGVDIRLRRPRHAEDVLMKKKITNKMKPVEPRIMWKGDMMQPQQ